MFTDIFVFNVLPTLENKNTELILSRTTAAIGTSASSIVSSYMKTTFKIKVSSLYIMQTSSMTQRKAMSSNMLGRSELPVLLRKAESTRVC